jgi:stress-induced morphogen
MDEWNSDEPLASDLPPQIIKCHYQGGKSLGLTFEWLNDHFTISDDEHLKSINPTDQPEEPEEVMNGNGELRQGDVLIEVNQQNIEKLTFDEIVSILKSCEPQDRILTFHRKESGEVVAVEPEDDNESESEESVAMNKTNNLPPNSSTCHRQLHQLFTSSPTLNLLHCQITNLSYFYRSRAELTSKKQLAFVIQQNSQHLRYDSSLYVMKVDQQDGNLKPMKKFLSSHSTRWGAYRHIEMKMKERDGNPFQTNSKTRGNRHGSNHSSVSGSRGFVGEVNPNDILSTHYRIQLVSEVFSDLNIYERLNLVYEVLTQEGYGKQYGPLYTSLGPQAGHESLDSCHLKHFSYVGKHVRNLPIFTFPNTDVNPLNLMIEPMTPSQWRPQLYSPPLSERYGKSHNEFRSQQVVVAAKPKAQRQRIKTLSMTNNTSSTSMTSFPFFSSSSSVPHSATTSSPLSLGPAGPASPHSPSSQLNTQRIKQELYQSSAELLGLDSHILSQQFHKKTGGVYSHFFKDLSPGIKSLVMSRYLENKQLIQKEGGRMKSKHARRGNIGDGPPPSAAAGGGGGAAGGGAGGGAGGRGRSNAAAPVTTMSIMKAKLEASKNSAEYDVGTSNEQDAEYDVGTSNEQEMMENYLLIVKKVEKYAICLQRIFRLKLFSMIQRRFYQCQVAVLTIQRVLRGRYGRVYYRLLRKLVPIAISRIITVYRAYQTRKRMKVWFALIQKATLVIAPILKRFVRKCVNLWLQRFHTAAKKIQSIIRLHLAKIKLYYHIGQKFYQEQLVCGVIRIQATYRGWKDRLKLRVLIEDYLRQVIDIPACILIQRIIRGILSKKVLQQKKLENFSAVRIQKYLLRCLHNYIIFV